MCNICENCGCEHNGDFGSGRFCSSKCARGFSTKSKRKEINEKVSKRLSGRKLSEETKQKLSKNNGSHREEVRKKIGEGVSKSLTPERIDKIRQSRIGKKASIETRLKESISQSKKCSSLEERQRLREIGRKGGFGKKGYINNIYYQSTLEKNCFEFLINNNINFIPHKSLPNSSKDCDVYLVDKDIWIELDGINREKRKKWLAKEYIRWIEKLDEYSNKNLNYVIIYSNNELIKYINDIYEIGN